VVPVELELQDKLLPVFEQLELEALEAQVRLVVQTFNAAVAAVAADII
jgi:hypothetical protein